MGRNPEAEIYDEEYFGEPRSRRQKLFNTQDPTFKDEYSQPPHPTKQPPQTKPNDRRWYEAIFNRK
jgi:hypothetical protein